MVKHKKGKEVSNKKKKGNKKDAPPKKIPTIEELLQAGDTASASNESDKALAFYMSAEQILREKPSPPTDQLVYVLEKCGEAKATVGDVEAARKDFENAIALLTTTPPKQPTTNAPQFQETLAGLHLYIGQLSAEQEALQAYKKGLECLQASVELRQKECANTPAQISEDDTEEMEEEGKEESKNNPSVALNEVRQKLASAQVTVAELYLTDLCFEESAEAECEFYVTKALQYSGVDGEPLVDALQTAASLRLSQQRKADARQLILRAYKKMRVGCEALSKLVGLGEEKDKRAVELLEVESDAADGLPSLEFRGQTAKFLLECGTEENDTAVGEETTKCHQAAIHVLGSLLAENDEVPEIWYLLGCAFHDSKNTENAKYYWNKALEMLIDIQKQMEEESDTMQGDDETEELDMQLQNIACQMEDVKSKLEDLEEEDAKMEE